MRRTEWGDFGRSLSSVSDERAVCPSDHCLQTTMTIITDARPHLRWPVVSLSASLKCPLIGKVCLRKRPDLRGPRLSSPALLAGARPVVLSYGKCVHMCGKRTELANEYHVTSSRFGLACLAWLAQVFVPHELHVSLHEAERLPFGSHSSLVIPRSDIESRSSVHPAEYVDGHNGPRVAGEVGDLCLLSETNVIDRLACVSH